MNSGFVCLCSLLFCSVAAESFYFPPQNASAAGNPLAALAMQYQMSLKYSSLILDFQSASAWIQVSTGLSQQLMKEYNDAKADGSISLEESDRSFEEFVDRQLERFPSSDNNLELQTENAIMAVTKLMLLQNAYSFEQAQQKHFESRAQMMMLQSFAQGSPVASYAVYMMYYKDMLQTLKSSLDFQRQDSWNTWVTMDMTETVVFADNTPKELDDTIMRLKVNAINHWQTQANLKLQITFIEYYMSMMLSGAARASASNAAASSFLQEEEEVSEEAEPAKPFFSPNNPYFWVYYMQVLKFYSQYMEVASANSFAQSAQLEANDDPSDDKQGMMLSIQGAQYMHQYASISLMVSYFNFYGMYMGGMSAHHNAAAMNSLIQTEQPQTPSVEIKTPEIQQ